LRYIVGRLEERALRMLATALFTLLLLGASQTGGDSAVKTELAEIATLHQKAVDGSAEAQFQLAEAYEKGAGIDRSDTEAARWYRVAAQQGYVPAEVQLGTFYWTGQGIPLDKKQAVSWYQRAAHEGNAAAMFNLGVAYFNGEGAPEDLGEARLWFILAEDGGSQQAIEAVHRSESGLQTQDVNDIYFSIGQRYQNGVQVRQNYAVAAKWYQKAAEGNDARSAMALAGLYASGRGVAHSFSQMFRWCSVAAEQNNPSAMYCVGKLYRDGAGTRKDSALAVQWFQRAVDGDFTAAYVELAEMYWNGEGVPADKVMAYVWASKASSTMPAAKKDLDRFRTLMTEQEIRKAESRMKKPSLRSPPAHD
jgi:uncharacterized protein